VKVETVHSKRQHSDGEVLIARKEANFVIMEGVGLGEQPKRRAFSLVDEVVALLPRRDGWATDVDTEEEEEAVRSRNDTGILQKEVRAHRPRLETSMDFLLLVKCSAVVLFGHSPM
jgi:hypothetical protein